MISLELSLDGQASKITVSENQYDSVYQPLTKRIINLQQRLQRRILIGIAGPPGCGKTFFSHVISAMINREQHHVQSVVVGMDGWHYSNQFLEEKITHIGGENRKLKSIKGAPETFDAEAFITFLKLVKEADTLVYPVYDRTRHEPIENKGQLTSKDNIILIEGNYLLLNEFPWQEIGTFLDDCFFIGAGEMLRWETLMRRHLKGGKDAVQAISHVRHVDMANARRIGRPKADVYLRRINEKELILFT